jgi:hypothetical protein
MFGSPELDYLNSAKYLFLRELSEPRDNSLRVVVQEGKARPDASGAIRNGVPEVAELRSAGFVIDSLEGCKSFELTWERYVAYLVTEELVGSCGKSDDEIYAGGLLRLYTKSHFLEHLARDTGGHTDLIQHYKLVCQNHLLDVASYSPPDIRLIDSTSTSSPRIQ